MDSGEVLVRGMLVGVGRWWPLRPAGQFISSVEGVRGGQGGAGAVLARAVGFVKSREIENLELLLNFLKLKKNSRFQACKHTVSSQ